MSKFQERIKKFFLRKNNDRNKIFPKNLIRNKLVKNMICCGLTKLETYLIIRVNLVEVFFLKKISIYFFLKFS